MEATQISASAGRDSGQEQKQGALSPDLSIYSSCDFYLWCFKVLPCSKRWSHEWTTCPFAHPGEKAKRRDPRTHQYDCEMCPAVVKGEQCELGAACPHSHHVFESWLHPQKFRTMLCKDGDSCNREVCFFAHGQEQLRVPTRDMVLGGPSRVRMDDDHAKQQPWTAPSSSCMAVSTAAVPGVSPQVTLNGSSNNSTRQIRFHYPLHHQGQASSAAAPAPAPTPASTACPACIAPAPTSLHSSGSLPSNSAAAKTPAGPQQIWRTGSGQQRRPSGCDNGTNGMAVMPVVSGKPLPFNWSGSPERNLSAAAAVQPQLDLLSGNALSGSSSILSGGSAMSAEVYQLLNSMMQQGGMMANRNQSAAEGGIPEGLNQSVSQGMNQGHGGNLSRAASGQQELGAGVSGDVAALLLQQQLGSAWGMMGGVQQQQQQGLQDTSRQLSLLQQLQDQLTLQEAITAVSQGQQHLSEGSSMSCSASFTLQQCVPDATATASGGNVSLEQMHRAMSNSASHANYTRASLVPSSNNLLPGGIAAGPTANNADLLDWLHLQQLAGGSVSSANGLLLQQQAAMQAAAAALQFRSNSGLMSQDAPWTTGDLINPAFGNTAGGRTGSAMGHQNPAAAAAAASMLVGMTPHAAAAGPALNRINSNGLQQQQQLTSDYLLQLQQNVSGGFAFHSAPEAAFLAANSGQNSALEAAGGRVSLDAAAGYAAMLANSRFMDKPAARGSFDERPMHHSANATLWPAPADELHSSNNYVANVVEPTFPPGHSAAGGSRQLGWL